MVGGGGHDLLRGSTGLNVLIGGAGGFDVLYGGGTQNYLYGMPRQVDLDPGRLDRRERGRSALRGGRVGDGLSLDKEAHGHPRRSSLGRTEISTAAPAPVFSWAVGGDRYPCRATGGGRRHGLSLRRHRRLRHHLGGNRAVLRLRLVWHRLHLRLLGASNVHGGSGKDLVYSGGANQYFYSGTGAEYFYERASTQTGGKMDVLDNFQTQSGAKGTFVFMPASEAASTSFVASNGGTYIVARATDGSGGNADIFVAGASTATVKAQTFFNL